MKRLILALILLFCGGGPVLVQAVPARYAVGWCQVAPKDLQDGLSPITIAENYIYKYQRNNPKFKSIDSSDFGRGAKVTLLSQPKLGEIEQTEYDWLYTPTKSKEDGTYVGQDHFIMKVENKGVAIFIHYFIEVIGNDPTTYIGSDGERHAHVHCKREFWKISLRPELKVLQQAMAT